MVTIVRCSRGHKFPVNLKKHLFRRHRFCPRCNEKVNVRPSRWSFLPNPKWPKMKENLAIQRNQLKPRGRRGVGRSPILARAISPTEIQARILAALRGLVYQQQQEEKKKERTS